MLSEKSMIASLHDKNGWTSPQSRPVFMNYDEASAVVGTEEF